MTVHVPTVAPHGVDLAVSLLWAALIVGVLAAALAIGYVAIQPAATTVPYPEVTSTWRLDYRHGEIDEGRTGPHSDVLQYRAGEINPTNP